MTTIDSNINPSIEAALEVLPAAPAKPKRPLTEATAARLVYEQNALVKKNDRKDALEAAGKSGSPAHGRCVESIRKTEALISKLQNDLRGRLLKASSSAPANDAEALADAG